MSKSFYFVKIDNNEWEVILIIFYYYLLCCLLEFRVGLVMFWVRKLDG